MKLSRVRLTMRLRLMMALIAVVAVVGWVGITRLDWRESYRQWRINGPARRKLDQMVTLRYPQGVPLDRLLADIKRQTATGASASGLIVYVDPQGMQDAGLTVASPVKIDVQAMPAKHALGSILKPLGLMIDVRDGLVCVVKEDDLDRE